MKMLYVTATAREADCLKRIKDIAITDKSCRFGTLDIYPLTGGIGSVSTMWNMFHWIIENGRPDIAINAGIAGSFIDTLSTGTVVIPVSEQFADLGIEDHDMFRTLNEAGLADPDEFPFVNGIIPADEKILSQVNFLKSVRSITVNTATGSSASCDRLKKKFNPDIETMEGASFFYLCRRERIPFLALRAISNKVEPRNRDSWNVELAIRNLAEKLRDVFLTLDVKQ